MGWSGLKECVHVSRFKQCILEYRFYCDSGMVRPTDQEKTALEPHRQTREARRQREREKAQAGPSLCFPWEGPG